MYNKNIFYNFFPLYCCHLWILFCYVFLIYEMLNKFYFKLYNVYCY